MADENCLSYEWMWLNIKPGHHLAYSKGCNSIVHENNEYNECGVLIQHLTSPHLIFIEKQEANNEYSKQCFIFADASAKTFSINRNAIQHMDGLYSPESVSAIYLSAHGEKTYPESDSGARFRQNGDRLHHIRLTGETDSNESDG